MRMDLSEKLVEEVKKYEIIYNLKYPGYNNLVKKDEIWADIAKRLKTDIKICKKRWKNLRDSYKRSKFPLPADKKRKWKYFKLLGFLDKVQTTRRKLGEALIEKNVADNFIEIDEDFRSNDQDSTENDSPVPANVMDIDEEDINFSSYKEEFVDFSSTPENSIRKYKELEEKLSNFLKSAQMVIASDPQVIKEDDSNTTSGIFRLLAQKIGSANLTPDQLTQVEGAVTQIVFTKLAEYQRSKTKKNK